MKKIIALIACILLLSSFALAQEKEAKGADDQVAVQVQNMGEEDQNQVHTQEADMIQEQKQLKDGSGEGQQIGDGSGEGQQASDGSGEGKQIGDGSGEGQQKGSPMLISAKGEKQHKGLANALSNVKNENAKAMIQKNMDKWLNKYQERQKNMEDVEVEEVNEETGALTIKAKEQVKWFGFIKGSATKRFEMDAKGNVNEKAPWYQFLYANTNSE